MVGSSLNIFIRNRPEPFRLALYNNHNLFSEEIRSSRTKNVCRESPGDTSNSILGRSSRSEFEMHAPSAVHALIVLLRMLTKHQWFFTYR